MELSPWMLVLCPDVTLVLIRLDLAGFEKVLPAWTDIRFSLPLVVPMP